MPFDFAALEASRIARSGPDKPLKFVPDARPKVNKSFTRTDWAMGRLYDDGRFEPLRKRLSRLDAEAQAGHARDRATDEEVGRQLAEGWTYAAFAIKGTFKPGGAASRRKR